MFVINCNNAVRYLRSDHHQSVWSDSLLKALCTLRCKTRMRSKIDFLFQLNSMNYIKSTFVVIIFVFKAAFVLCALEQSLLCRRFLEMSSTGFSLSQFVLFLHAVPGRLMMIRF